jgi:iron complex transport system ATP-binding protein
MIDIDSVCAGYGDIRALEGVTLRIEQGEFIGIIGPNGSGKSTLLRVMAGVLCPWEGSVTLLGRPLEAFRRREIARILAMVTQENHFAFDFSVRDVVSMGRHPHLGRLATETSQDFQTIEHAMESTMTWDLRDRSIQELSGGERQRVVIARAIAQSPQILLIDEPVSHLDFHHQIEIMDLVAGLNRQGMTIICVSHDLNLAAEYCNRLVLMKGGRVCETGAPSEIMVPELLARAYGLHPLVERSPLTGAPMVILGPRDKLENSREAW